MIRTSGAAKVITARELSRRTGLVIDDVLASGSPAIVTRHGRAVVMVIPVSGQLSRYDDPKDGPSSDGATARGTTGDPAADELATKIDELSDTERSVYYALTDDPGYPQDIVRRASLEDVRAGSIALVRLEIKGLAKRTWSGLFRRA